MPFHSRDTAQQRYLPSCTCRTNQAPSPLMASRASPGLVSSNRHERCLGSRTLDLATAWLVPPVPTA